MTNRNIVSVIVPTYNERENIRNLIPIISENLRDFEHEIIVVDDNSPDGTAMVVEELSKDYHVKVLKRSGKLGLASAVVHGFKHARGDYLGVIDADLQHPPEQLKDFVINVMNGSDVAVGSRYTTGGNTEGWSTFRTIVSRGATLLSKPLTKVKDPMSGYFFLKRKVIKNISFEPTGYKILLEILTKGAYNKVKEIPYTFRIRTIGKSKLGVGEFSSYLKLLYQLYGFKLNQVYDFRIRRKFHGIRIAGL